MALLFSSLIAIPLFWGGGMINTRAGGDSPFLLVRLEQLVTMLRAGQIPPRWMPDGAYGYGYPFFNHYGALPYYMAALLKLLGWGYIPALQLTQVMGFVGAALAMYGLTKRWTGSGWAAFLASVAYTYAPFHVVNVYVRGDSLSEFYAFVFFPLILWAMSALHARPSWRRGALLSLSYGGLVLTHNVSALIFSPFAGLYALLLFLRSGQRRWAWLAQATASILAGLAVSAWFWWPAFMERGLGHMGDMTTGYFHYAGHFRGRDLIQPRLLFDYTIGASQTPFAMGLVQALVAAAGLLALVWLAIARANRPLGQTRCDREASRDESGQMAHAGADAAPGRWGPEALFVALLFLGATLLITPLSTPLWAHVPLLPMVQFPWRFLSLQALGGALLAGYLVKAWSRRQRSTPWRTMVLAVFVVASGLLGLKPERLEISEADITRQRLRLYEQFTGNIGTTIRYEYLPTWVDVAPVTSEAVIRQQAKGTPLTLSGSAETELLDAQPAQQTWQVSTGSTGAQLAFQTYYFPGWQAYVDGERVEIQPLEGLGFIQMAVPAGAHEVVLRFGHTRSRAPFELLSLLTALGLAIAIGWNRPRPQTMWRGLAVAAVGLVGLWLLAQMAGLSRPQAMDSAYSDLSMDFDRQAYLHHNANGIDFDGVARLQDYRLDSERFKAGETIALMLRWSQHEPALRCVVELDTMAALRHASGPPLAHSEAILAASTAHALTIPADTAQGIYLLRLQVWDGEQILPPRNAQGETLGQTYLQPLYVDNALQSELSGEAWGRFGDCFELADMVATQDGNGLAVELTWNVYCEVAQEYALSVRLNDGNGRRIAALDSQPNYGFYPTHLWRAGQQIPTRCYLTLPPGTPPRADYQLEVVMYEPDSLAAIGTASIPNVAVTQATRVTYGPPTHTWPEIDLIAAGLAATTIDEGGTVGLNLTWGTAVSPSDNYRYRLYLTPEHGEPIAMATHPLVEGYETKRWQPNTLVNEHGTIADLAAEIYEVEIALLDGAGQLLGRYPLPERLTVRARPRTYERPDIQCPLPVEMGDQVALLGYDLIETDTDWQLVLYWQARQAIDADYKVFLHALDVESGEIVTQRDQMPQNNGYPTSQWAAGEVVRDEMTIPKAELTAGWYQLALGMYDPATAQRLETRSDALVQLSDNRIMLPERVQVP